MKNDNNKIQISISLPAALLEKVDRLADGENRNRSNFIATELQRVCDEMEAEPARKPAA